jgi:hypothetical protein
VGSQGQREAHWPGAAVGDVAIGTRLNRLLPIQCSGKLDNVLFLLINPFHFHSEELLRVRAAERVGRPIC